MEPARVLGESDELGTLAQDLAAVDLPEALARVASAVPGEGLAAPAERCRRTCPRGRGSSATGGGAATQDYGIENGVLSEFLGLGTTAVRYDLASCGLSRRGFAAYVPDDFLIIAPAAGGSLTLKLSDPDPDRGSVWWADDDMGEELDSLRGEPVDPLPEIMRRLADDLPAFLRDYPRQQAHRRQRPPLPRRSRPAGASPPPVAGGRSWTGALGLWFRPRAESRCAAGALSGRVRQDPGGRA